MYSHRFPLKRDIWKFRVVILCAMISTAEKKKKKKTKSYVSVLVQSFYCLKANSLYLSRCCRPERMVRSIV